MSNMLSLLCVLVMSLTVQAGTRYEATYLGGELFGVGGIIPFFRPDFNNLGDVSNIRLYPEDPKPRLFTYMDGVLVNQNTMSMFEDGIVYSGGINDLRDFILFDFSESDPVNIAMRVWDHDKGSLPLGTDSAFSFGLNNRGDYISWYQDDDQNLVSELRNHKSESVLIFPGKFRPEKISNNRVVIGHGGEGYDTPAYYTEVSGVQNLPLDDGITGSAKDVNVFGDIVGSISVESGRKPVVWENGVKGYSVKNLEGFPGQPSGGFAIDINDHGVIIGASNYGNRSDKVVWNLDGKTIPQRLSDLVDNYKDVGVRNVIVINNKNQILVEGSSNRGYILNPYYTIEKNNISSYTVPERRQMPEPLPLQEAKSGLIFITHGWQSDVSGWVTDLKNIFNEKLGDKKDQWDLEVFDWSNSAKYDVDGNEITAREAAEVAKEIGTFLGKIIKQGEYDKVHLVSHSAGSWMIQNISRELADTDTLTHITFLDAFQPVGWTEDLGKYADFAEHYQDKWAIDYESGDLGTVLSGGTTGQDLENCFNYDLTNNPDKGTRITFSDNHAWPYEWYKNYSKGSGYGLDLALALRDEPITHDVFGFERLNQKTKGVEYSGIGPFDSFESETSSTGTILLAQSSLEMTTGSPVWTALLVPVNEPVNLLRLSLQFTSEEGSEGVLSVFWNDVFVGDIDERFIVDSEQQYVFYLPDIYTLGEYTLGLRLDSFTDMKSSVSVKGIELGLFEPVQIPEPTALFLIVTFFFRRKLKNKTPLSRGFFTLLL